MVNRGAILLGYRDAAIRWINETGPTGSRPITADELIHDRTVYLVSDEDVVDQSAAEEWVELNYRQLFETELEGWTVDTERWPEPRTPELFREWFRIEHHSVILDTLDGELRDVDAEE